MAGSYHDNRPLNPVHAILLGFLPSLFTVVLLGDVANRSNDTTAWAVLAVWLIGCGLVAGSLVLLWVLVGLVRAGRRRLRRSVLYFAALSATWALGLLNAVAHQSNHWTDTLAGLFLSASTCVLALIAAWTGYLGVPRQLID